MSAEKRRVLFACIPLYGHLGPLLRQAQELSRRGWDAFIATSEEGREHLEGRLGEVHFENLGPGGMEPAEAQRIVERISIEPNFIKGTLEIAQSLARTWPVLYDAITAAIARLKPDLLVVDFATSAALDAAEASGLPFIINNADLLPVLPAGLLPLAPDVPSLFSGKTQRELGRLDRALAPLTRWANCWMASLIIGRAQNACRRTRALPAIDMHTRLSGRTLLVNSAFGFEYARPLPPGVHMTGPMLDPFEPMLNAEEESWLADGPPVVFVNLGTVAAPSPEHVSKLARGLSSSTFRVLWVLRPPARDHLPASLAANIRVTSWVSSQLNLLAHHNVRAFVSHGGTNSVQESLWAGTPVITFPMFAAQKDVGLRVVDAGAGVLLDKARFTERELRESIERVFSEPSFHKATWPIRRSIEAAGGVARAADLIERVAAHASTA